MKAVGYPQSQEKETALYRIRVCKGRFSIYRKERRVVGLPLQEVVADAHTEVGTDDGGERLAREVVARHETDACLKTQAPPLAVAVLRDGGVDEAVEFAEGYILVLAAGDDLVVFREIDFERDVHAVSKLLQTDIVPMDAHEAVRSVFDEPVLIDGVAHHYFDVAACEEVLPHLLLQRLYVGVHLSVEFFQFLDGGDERLLFGIELAVGVFEEADAVERSLHVVPGNVEFVPQISIPEERGDEQQREHRDDRCRDDILLVHILTSGFMVER